MSDLLTLSMPHRSDDGRLLWEVPDGWQQGRGCFGGMLLATMVRAAQRHVPDDMPLRSLGAVLVAPALPGTAELAVATVRDGRNTAVRRVELGREETTCAQATLVFGRARKDTPSWSEVAGPELLDWQSVPPAPVQMPMAPPFSRNVEFRLTGPAPLTGDPSGASGWVRFRQPGPRLDAASLAALADAWWPAALNRLRAPRPMATIHYVLQIVDDGRDLDPAAPVFHRAFCDTASAGYVTERRELFGVDGRLLCINQQTFVMIA